MHLDAFNSLVRKDIVTQCHMGLSIYTDSCSNDNFLLHLSKAKGLIEKLVSLPVESQLDWIKEYWKLQLLAANLDGQKFVNEWDNMCIKTIKDFDTRVMPFISDCAERHNLPNVNICLPDFK